MLRQQLPLPHKHSKQQRRRQQRLLQGANERRS
jgi:hypothetical protein